MGGGRRLDVRINLIAMGKAFQCTCHRDFHDGHISRGDILAMVAQRENTLQDHIEEVIYLLIRLPKEPSVWEIKSELRKLGASVYLAERTLAEIFPSL